MSAQTFTNGTSSDTCKAICSNHAENVPTTRIYQGNSSINSQTKRIRWVIIKQFDDHNSYTFIFATILILWTRDKQRTISEQRTDGTQQNNFCVRRSSSVGHVDTSNVVIFTVLT